MTIRITESTELDKPSWEGEHNTEKDYKKLRRLKRFKKITKHMIKDKGVHKIFRYKNGYGASVVRFRSLGSGYGSYTNDKTEWELAVLKFDEEGYTLTYNTPITSDVIGHLNRLNVEYYLGRIKRLNNVSVFFNNIFHIRGPRCLYKIKIREVKQNGKNRSSKVIARIKNKWLSNK